MNKLIGLAALLLAGGLAMPGNFWQSGVAYGQGSSRQLSDEEYEKLKQKRQEQWQTLEDIQKRQENTGERLQEAVKRRQDAERRQKAAEQQMREKGK